MRPMTTETATTTATTAPRVRWPAAMAVVRDYVESRGGKVPFWELAWVRRAAWRSPDPMLRELAAAAAEAWATADPMEIALTCLSPQLAEAVVALISDEKRLKRMGARRTQKQGPITLEGLPELAKIMAVEQPKLFREETPRGKTQRKVVWFVAGASWEKGVGHKDDLPRSQIVCDGARRYEITRQRGDMQLALQALCEELGSGIYRMNTDGGRERYKRHVEYIEARMENVFKGWARDTAKILVAELAKEQWLLVPPRTERPLPGYTSPRYGLVTGTAEGGLEGRPSTVEEMREGVIYRMSYSGEDEPPRMDRFLVPLTGMAHRASEAFLADAREEADAFAVTVERELDPQKVGETLARYVRWVPQGAPGSSAPNRWGFCVDGFWADVRDEASGESFRANGRPWTPVVQGPFHDLCAFKDAETRLVTFNDVDVVLSKHVCDLLRTVDRRDLRTLAGLRLQTWWLTMLEAACEAAASEGRTLTWALEPGRGSVADWVRAQRAQRRSA